MLKNSSVLSSKVQEKFLKECDRLSITPSAHYLIVNIEAQQLFHYCNNDLISYYTISTSEKEPSCIQDSFGTPWGMHKVQTKIGEGAPLGMVFKHRIATGQKYWECEESIQEQRLVATRILWLKGLESGLNCGAGIDSFERYIYIHGTNREQLLGSPATLGCITLSNQDVIALYDAVPCESLVWICKSV